MSAFRYVARNAAGQRQRGVLDADSARHARDQLRAQHLIPIEVISVTDNAQRAGKPKQRRWAPQALALVTRQLATLIKAAMPVDVALEAVAQQAASSRVAHVLLALRARVMEGFGLATAMSDYPKIFPTMYRATIAAGEQSGQLDHVLEHLADYVERQQHIRQKVRQALIYPTLMTAVSLAIVFFLLTHVIPEITQVFQDTHQTLPLATTMLLAISAAVRRDGLWGLLALIAGGWGIRTAYRHPKYRRWIDRMLIKLPLVGSILQSLNTARYGQTLSILLRAGVPMLDAMQAAAHTVSLMPFQDALETALNRVREGTRLHLALKETRYFSPMFLHMIASGEQSGELAPMLDKAAAYLEQSLTGTIDTTLTLFEPIMILVMGAVVLFIVLAIMLPIFSLDQLGGQP